MKNFYAAALVAGLMTTVACSDSPTYPTGVGTENTLGIGEPGPTIAEIAVSNDNFTTLVAALQRANLVSAFTGVQPYTVFAPTNDAFDAAAVALLGPGNSGLDLVNGLPVATLTSVLLYHVSIGTQDAATVLGNGSVPMLDGNRAAIAVVGGVPKIDDVTIAATDVMAQNGVIHVIDGVLLPPALR